MLYSYGVTARKDMLVFCVYFKHVSFYTHCCVIYAQPPVKFVNCYKMHCHFNQTLMQFFNSSIIHNI